MKNMQGREQKKRRAKTSALKQISDPWKNGFIYSRGGGAGARPSEIRGNVIWQSHNHHMGI